MARRRSSSVLEDLFEMVSRLPWWVGALLAVVSYFWLHNLTVGEVASPTKPGEMGAAVVGTLARSLATVGQYVLPLLLLLGAAASAIGRMKRKRLHSGVAMGGSSQVLRDMNWREFEVLVGEAFRRKGFIVAETGSDGADGGVDLVLNKGSERFLVQCKQWRAYKVSVNTVRELYGVMHAQGAVGAFVVTSGEFTRDAAEFARGRNIELVDGKQLFDLVRQTREARDANNRSALTGVPALSQGPTCPRCGSSMMRRVARKGAEAGNAFWGCSGFPRCKGTRSIAPQ